MPDWVSYIIATAAVVTAVGAIFRMVVRPGVKLASAAEETIPLLKEMADAFRGKQHVFNVLEEIVQQLRNDHGTSVKDTVDELKDLAQANADSTAFTRHDLEETQKVARQTAEDLRVGVETQRRLDAEDREVLRGLMKDVAVITERLREVVQSGSRIEDSGKRIEDAAEGVASDLADARSRADLITNQHPGEASDAAAQSPQNHEDDDEE